jgi:hypothetical protein
LQYIPELARPVSHPYYNHIIIKIMSALELVHDFAGAALGAGLQMKADYTIIDHWPIKISGGTPTSKAKTSCLNGWIISIKLSISRGIKN